MVGGGIGAPTGEHMRLDELLECNERRELLCEDCGLLTGAVGTMCDSLGAETQCEGGIGPWELEEPPLPLPLVVGGGCLRESSLTCDGCPPEESRSWGLLVGPERLTGEHVGVSDLAELDT